ncbi:hypothetical protein H920_10797 [Fukomys damarensis]|uniref:Uncharacterized protein n=1 Tax=Fukomys damarensis TaxID=885580 RepID=A0A091D9P8_FUKDA|nr:hypothetical protein H920_10797 [Fukomys damarensis]
MTATTCGLSYRCGLQAPKALLTPKNITHAIMWMHLGYRRESSAVSRSGEQMSGDPQLTDWALGMKLALMSDRTEPLRRAWEMTSLSGCALHVAVLRKEGEEKVCCTWPREEGVGPKKQMPRK